MAHCQVHHQTGLSLNCLSASKKLDGRRLASSLPLGAQAPEHTTIHIHQVETSHRVISVLFCKIQFWGFPVQLILSVNFWKQIAKRIELVTFIIICDSKIPN